MVWSRVKTKQTKKSRNNIHFSDLHRTSENTSQII